MKKAQAAMEFFMTYGAAIFIVLVVIGALFSFGIIDIKNKLPEQSMFPPPFSSIDYTIDESGVISIKLKNNLDARLDLLSTGYFGTDECSTMTGISFSESLVLPLSEFILNFTCPDAVGNRFHSYLTFSYNVSGKVHSTTGYVTING